MVTPQQSSLGKLIDIPTNGLGGHHEILCEGVDGHKALAPHQIHDFLLAENSGSAPSIHFSSEI
jgi:hypothetical protein